MLGETRLFICLLQVGKITGAKIYVFLLEHSRVSLAGPHRNNGGNTNDSTFHIFNYVLAGLSAEGKLKEYFPANDFPGKYFPKMKVSMRKEIKTEDSCF